MGRWGELDGDYVPKRAPILSYHDVTVMAPRSGIVHADMCAPHTV